MQENLAIVAIDEETRLVGTRLEASLLRRSSLRRERPGTSMSECGSPSSGVRSQGMGMRFGAAFLACVIAVGGVLVGCGSGAGSSIPDSKPTASSHRAPDAIEQAQAVIGRSHTYEEVKGVTDRALQAGGEGLTNENRSRVWSSVLATRRGLVDKGYPSPDAYQVMDCIPGSIASRGAALTDAIAYCSLQVAGIPESEW